MKFKVFATAALLMASTSAFGASIIECTDEYNHKTVEFAFDAEPQVTVTLFDGKTGYGDYEATVDHTPTRNAGQTIYDIEAYVIHPRGITGTTIHARLFQPLSGHVPSWGSIHVAGTYRYVGFDATLSCSLKSGSEPMTLPND